MPIPGGFLFEQKSRLHLKIIAVSVGNATFVLQNETRP